MPFTSFQGHLWERRLFSFGNIYMLFVFSGNLGRMETIRSFLSACMTKNGMLTSVLSSQIISNVPAAVLLSSFTENWKALWWVPIWGPGNSHRLSGKPDLHEILSQDRGGGFSFLSAAFSGLERWRTCNPPYSRIHTFSRRSSHLKTGGFTVTSLSLSLWFRRTPPHRFSAYLLPA